MLFDFTVLENQYLDQLKVIQERSYLHKHAPNSPCDHTPNSPCDHAPNSPCDHTPNSPCNHTPMVRGLGKQLVVPESNSPGLLGGIYQLGGWSLHHEKIITLKPPRIKDPLRRQQVPC